MKDTKVLLLAEQVRDHNLDKETAHQLMKMLTVHVPTVPSKESIESPATSKSHWAEFYWRNNSMEYPVTEYTDLLLKDFFFTIPRSAGDCVGCHYQVTDDEVRMDIFLPAGAEVGKSNRSFRYLYVLPLGGDDQSPTVYEVGADGELRTMPGTYDKSCLTIGQAIKEFVIRWFLFTRLNKFEIGITDTVRGPSAAGARSKMKIKGALSQEATKVMDFNPVAVDEVILYIPDGYTG